MRINGPAVAAVLVLLASDASATPICRWIDGRGRTQFAESVPVAYGKVAICSDSQQFEIPDAQRLAAEQRAADDAAQARQPAARPPAGRASAPRGAAGAASGTVARRPAEVVTDATDCDTWWRLFDESVECFGPHRTTRGATKVEAFDRCNVIESPEPRCGPRID